MSTLDEQYLEDFARQQQAHTGPGTYDPRCPGCGHAWHGLACTLMVWVSGRTGEPCPCPGGAA